VEDAPEHEDAGQHQRERERVVGALVGEPLGRPHAGEPVAAAGERVPLV